MDGKPYRLLIRVCPLHPMLLMPVNTDVIAGYQRKDVFPPLEAQKGVSPEQYHPFVVLLIIPESIR